MKYILDTNILTEVQKGNESIRIFISDSNNDIGITIVTKAEILLGRFHFLMKAENAVKLETAQKWLIESEKLILQFPIIQFNKESFAIFDEFRQNSKYRKIGRADMLIASIGLANRAVLVTRNVKHFKQFPNLNVENWVD